MGRVGLSYWLQTAWDVQDLDLTYFPHPIRPFSQSFPLLFCFLLDIYIRVIDPFTIKPLDADTIISSARATGGRIITVEDHYKEGKQLT